MAAPCCGAGRTVSPLNIPAWRGFPLRRRLADHLGLPVAVDNDAKALALGEGWLGAARGCDNYLAMVVSTGVGGGIVLDGRLLDGRDGNAGHIGHVVVEPDGRRCACGGRGCLEAEASGLSIAAITGRPAHEAAEPPCGGGAAPWSVGPWPRWPTCWTSSWRWWPGRWRSGSASRSSTRAQHEIDERARLDFSRGTRMVPAGLGADGPLLGAAAAGPARRGVVTGPARRRPCRCGRTGPGRLGRTVMAVAVAVSVRPTLWWCARSTPCGGWPRPAGGAGGRLCRSRRRLVGVPDGDRLRPERGGARRRRRRDLPPSGAEPAARVGPVATSGPGRRPPDGGERRRRPLALGRAGLSFPVDGSTGQAGGEATGDARCAGSPGRAGPVAHDRRPPGPGAERHLRAVGGRLLPAGRPAGARHQGGAGALHRSGVPVRAGHRSRTVGGPPGALRAGPPPLPGGREPADRLRPGRVAVPVLRARPPRTSIT